ncbi:MAG: hypothetical protein EXS13_12155 [Planctomycetes bacterium]|nr:hypothetical protein [Planctomycetota bacterium]
MGERLLSETIATTRRRFAVAAWLGEWARHGAVAWVVAGVAGLLARRFLDRSWGQAAWLVLLVVPAAATAWLRARHRFVSSATVATWLDVRGGADGRLVTAFELRDTLPQSAEAIAAPALKLRFGLLARPALPASTFFALALWIPLPAAAGALELPKLQASELDRLAEKLATLEETVQLDEGLRAELAERLERAKEQLDSAPLASGFEARDQIEARLEQEATAAQERFEQAQGAHSGPMSRSSGSGGSTPSSVSPS